MSLVVRACENLYYSEYNSDQLLKQLQESFDCSISSIERFLVTPIHKILNQEPCLYWNKETAHQVLDTLEMCSVATNKLIIKECTF